MTNDENRRAAEAFIRAQLPRPAEASPKYLTRRQQAEAFRERRAAFVAERNAKLLKHKPRSMARFCSCCEQDGGADWIEERNRYECDKCQRNA